jgi:hypothetical protein
MNMPLDTRKCNSATPDVQVSCLQDLQANMEALLHGSAKQSTVRMAINGSDPRTNITFTCQGLNGCIAALQSVDRNLKTEVRRIQTFKQSYVTAAKQSVQNFTKQMAAMMSGQSAALTNSLKGINTALSSLGVGGVSIPKVDCEQPSFDSNGLPQPPTSCLKLIGCQMNPQMLDVSGNDFSSALSNIGNGMRDLDAKVGPLNDAMGRIRSLPNQCRSQLMSRRSDQLQRDTDQIASGNCQFSDEFCRQSGTISDLGSSLSGIANVPSDAVTNAQSALDSGIGSCTDQTAVSVRRYNNCIATQPNPLPSGSPGCGSPPAGVAAASPVCRSIASRIRADVNRLGSGSSSTGSAGGAQ